MVIRSKPGCLILTDAVQVTSPHVEHENKLISVFFNIQMNTPDHYSENFSREIQNVLLRKVNAKAQKRNHDE